jgi:hypothetical protein
MITDTDTFGHSGSSYGNNISNCAGINTSKDGINKLYVPIGSTGWNDDEVIDVYRKTNYIKTVLCNPNYCGFTIEYV